MPIVDIIIPAYNAAHYLPTALDSVIAQTFQDWRILLVDDGSTDNTAEVVAPYIEQLGPRLKYIHQPNGGLPHARNTAIRNGSAEFLALLDADDIWLPHRLEDSLRAFAGRPLVGVSYGLISWIDPQGNITGTFAGNPEPKEGRIAPAIFMRKVDLPCPTMTFRRRCVEEVGGFDETMRATEDRDLWLRIALRYEVACIPRVIAYYRTSPQSMSADPDRMLRAQLQFIAKHQGVMGWIPRRIALGRVYKQRADAFLQRNQLRAALLNALHAVALFPFDPDNLRTAASLLLRSIRLTS
jgi:glycosyltransferase involved in cell wall biosynthesis